jgi:hypothetical protein
MTRISTNKNKIRRMPIGSAARRRSGGGHGNGDGEAAAHEPEEAPEEPERASGSAATGHAATGAAAPRTTRWCAAAAALGLWRAWPPP